MLTALIWTLVTALFFATISATVSFLARDKMSSFQFFTVSNLLAAAVAWVVLPNWSMAGEVNWGMLFAFTLVTGVVNTASQAMLVLTLKLGHNGLTIAIRNLAAVISMFFALIFLHEKVSVVNFTGVALIIVSLALIALFSRKNSVSSNLKKWVPCVIIALLLSGAYQILLTGSLLLPEATRRAGVL
ncbi:MAG: EamA family transporter, partial [Lentisphaeria bacterium]|nr:EamA family transporter [Lentisphaeria bacterium]